MASEQAACKKVVRTGAQVMRGTTVMKDADAWGSEAVGEL